MFDTVRETAVIGSESRKEELIHGLMSSLFEKIKDSTDSNTIITFSTDSTDSTTVITFVVSFLIYFAKHRPVVYLIVVFI